MTNVTPGETQSRCTRATGFPHAFYNVWAGTQDQDLPHVALNVTQARADHRHLFLRLRHPCKCLVCGDIFDPHPRKVVRQKICLKPSCKAALKAARDRRWLDDKNPDYHHGPIHVACVKAWKRQHRSHSSARVTLAGGTPAGGGYAGQPGGRFYRICKGTAGNRGRQPTGPSRA